MNLSYKEAELAYFSANDQLELAIANFDKARYALQSARHGFIPPIDSNGTCCVEEEAYGKALHELGIAISLEEKCESEWQRLMHPSRN